MSPQTQNVPSVDESTLEAAQRYYREHADLKNEQRASDIELEAKKATADLLAKLAIKNNELPPPEGESYQLPPPKSDEVSVK